MRKNPYSDQISLPQRQTAASSKDSNLRSFLTYLVYEAHGLRLGLELSLCVISYTFVNLLVPWAKLGIPIKWSTLISWFGCSFAIILLDQLVLCRSVHTFRRSYLLALSGAYEKALAQLERIGPQSNAFIRLPLALYHFHRAEVFTHSEDFLRAEAELQLAEMVESRAEHVHIRKSLYFRAKGEFPAARSELELARQALGEAPALVLEQGVLELEDRSDLWSAKKHFKRVVALPDAPHFAGESCHGLANAYLSVVMLATGEAEEGLEKLTGAIERLRSAVLYVDTLRPILGRLLLERSMYYSTHREPTSAVIDLKLGLSLCTFGTHVRLGTRIKQELLDRHGVRVF